MNSYWAFGMTASSLFSISKRKKSAEAKSGEEGGARDDLGELFGQKRLDLVGSLDKKVGDPSCWLSNKA